MVFIADGQWLKVNETVLEIPGDRPQLLWVRTCENPQCQCRNALVVATEEGPEVLREEAAIARAALQSGTAPTFAGGAGRSATQRFSLDIDTAKAVRSRNGSTDDEEDVGDDPRAGPIVRGIDGEMLDEIGRLWYRGKGLANPEQGRSARAVAAAARKGRLVAWDRLYARYARPLRQDLYEIGGGLYAALEYYCPRPGCVCGETVVEFVDLASGDPEEPGGVRVGPCGPAEFEPGPDGLATLELLWEAFTNRHPGHVARFARRYEVIRQLGALRGGGSPSVTRPAAPLRPAVKVGRNDPCPCGSGRKYKKCCGEHPAGGSRDAGPAQVGP